jgi:hypothetical protein
MTIRHLITALLGTCLGGCDDMWEQATVTISYAPASGANELGPLTNDRKRVEEVFINVSERQGYKCRAHVKREEELTCRGPNDLHLVFQPSLNKQEFVAKFSWADVGGRTHEKFMQHVSGFKNGFSAIFGEDHVRLEETI